MNADSFERLSKSMAAATSRRGLLRVFVAGLTAAAVGRLSGSPKSEALQPCTSDLQCPAAERCVSGSCVADSDPAALTGRPGGRITLGGPPPNPAACGSWLQGCCPDPGRKCG